MKLLGRWPDASRGGLPGLAHAVNVLSAAARRSAGVAALARKEPSTGVLRELAVQCSDALRDAGVASLQVTAFDVALLWRDRAPHRARTKTHCSLPTGQ